MNKNIPVMFTRSVDITPIRKGIFKDPMNDTLGFRLRIIKDATNKSAGIQEAHQQLVFGYANVTIQEDGTVPFDWQGDMIETSELETAAYTYVLNNGFLNQEHISGTDCGFLVESFMITKEKLAAMGIPEGYVPEGWWVGFYIPDPEVYAKVLDGTYNMFSIEGKATRVPVQEYRQRKC